MQSRSLFLNAELIKIVGICSLEKRGCEQENLCRWHDPTHHTSAQTRGQVMVKIIKKTEASMGFQYMVQISTFLKVA